MPSLTINTNADLGDADTKKALMDGREKVQHIIPRLSREDLYLTRNAPPLARNDLPRFKSIGSESVLESYHAVLQHFGNTGSRADTTDSKVLLGTA